ncbi:G2/mitotic-specific cyclin-B [Ostrea edulis]|uniref:G2/mitotic-specific cyclin-B n=1 Tax=Ostrea edulis TaxID=37623 RepID=UPI0024AF7E14|nr:G2/mitotic-specific cyclin-B [Ostrea edulis]
MTETKAKPKGLSIRPINVDSKGQLTAQMGKLKIETQKKVKPSVICQASIRRPTVTVQPACVEDVPPELPPKTKKSQRFSIPNFDVNHEEKQREIEKIEKELARDLFKSPTYAHDIYSYLKMVEKRWHIPEDFLDHGEINAKTRAILMDWFIQVQVYLELLDTTLHMAVAFVDRILSNQKVTANSLQLLGITCILIAAKYYERFPPQVSDLVYLTDNTYKVSQVFVMEMIVLKKFKFDLSTTDPVSTMEHFLEISPTDSMTKSMAKYMLDLTTTCHKFASILPTVLAASCVYVARKLFVMDKVWTCGLEYFSGYTEKDLMKCVTELLRMLIKAPTAKLQGARKKHAASTFTRISHHKLLETKPAAILKALENK